MNKNLGNYDMVLALSSSKINHQLKNMWKHHAIPQDITVACGFSEPLLEIHIDWDETKIREVWNREWRHWEKVKFALIAKIEAPKIHILEDTCKELILQISFKKGSKLLYFHGLHQAEYDFKDGIQCAFKVPIYKEKITSDRKILEISENGEVTEKTLRDKGINDNDFTVHALFLDFTHLVFYDNSNYNRLPEDKNTIEPLKAVLKDYFKKLGKSDNPYVLGYGISKNKVQEQERALFYPTEVAYSTSYSNKKRASTFNFLMLFNNNSHPNSGDAGVLPTSLMEYAQDKTATVSGVFGLDQRQFVDNYIPLLSQVLHDKIRSNMGDKYDGTGYVASVGFEIGFKWDDVKGNMRFHYDDIYPNATSGVDIKYKIKVNAKVHQEKKEIIGTLGVDWDVSTSGCAIPSFFESFMHDKKPPIGHEGILNLNLKAGANGKLELKVNNYKDKFELGFDTYLPTYSSTLDKLWDGLNALTGIYLELMHGIKTDIGNSLDNLADIDSIGDSINIQNLENLERKVILPVSSRYMYKNILLCENHSDDNATLLFDTSYTGLD